MASREARRRLERKAEQKTTQEKRLERHPAIFAISFIILVVVIISFIFYGSAGSMGSDSSGKLTFGKYKNTDISLMRSQKGTALNYFTGKMDSYQPQFQDAQPEQARGYWRQAFNDTSFHYALLDLAHASGYEVSKDLIVDALQGSQLFLDKNGDFDEKEFTRTSQLDRTQLQSTLEEQLIHQQFLDDLLFAKQMSSKEVELYKSMASKERRFNYVTFKYSDFPEEKVIEYAKTNAEKFKKMKLSRIFLLEKTQKEAEDIQNMYNKKEKTFEDLAKTYSKDIYATNGGDMGVQYFYQVNNYVESIDSVREIFALKKDFLALIKNGDNYEIYRCNESATNADTNDVTTRGDILKFMQDNERNTIQDYSLGLAKSFKDKAATKPFADVCKEIKQFPPYETEFFPINYRGFIANKAIKVKGENPSLATAETNKTFFQEAFALSKDAISNPIPLDDQVVVLRLIEEKSLTEDDWKTINSSFNTNLQLYQYDPVAGKYINQLYAIAKQSDMSPDDLLFRYLLNTINKNADEKGIPYQYAMDSLFYTYKDFEDVVIAIRSKNLTDNFEDTYTKMISGGGTY